jgi:hypothetical protein
MGNSFRNKWGGEQGVAGVPVLWEGMKFQPVSMNLKDAEFLDSRKFSVAEIARWFGVPPHMVGDVERSTSWGSGIEQQGLGFLIYSLQPWIELLEQSIRYTFIIQPERYYAKFNANAILRMDQKAQADMFAVMIEKGILSPNECRELLDRNPREGGDEYVDVAKSEPAPAPPPPPPAGEPDPDEDEDEEDEAEAARSLARALAESRAGELLDEEREALAALGKEHARDVKAWRAAVQTYYGRFAKRVAAALICSQQSARGWCETRRGLVIADGLGALGQDGTATLAAMALEGINHARR